MRFRFLVPVLILSALLAFTLNEVISYSRNTVTAHQNWIRSRDLLAFAAFGSVDPRSRVEFNRNHLTLNKWNGFNEYLLNRILHPAELSFSFRLANDAYLMVIFNKTAAGASGFRISRSANFPNLFFRVDNEGKFVFTQAIPEIQLTDAWQTARLKFAPSSVSLICNRKDVQTVSEKNEKDQVIGFRSGYNTAIVDDVCIKNASGELKVREDFRNHQRNWIAILICFLLPTGAVGLALRSPSKVKAIHVISFIEFIAISVLIAYLCFDYFYWSEAYHYVRLKKGIHNHLPVDSVERVRQFLFTRFPFYDRSKPYHPGNAKIVSFLKFPGRNGRYSSLWIYTMDNQGVRSTQIEDNQAAIGSYLQQSSLTENKRVLLLGTSQTFGAGAAQDKDRIAYRLCELLNPAERTQNTMIINAAKPATQSFDLSKRFQQHLYLLKPQLVLINLSTNDYAETFRQGLESLVDLALKADAKPVFILEPNSVESYNPVLLNKHAIMSSLGEQKHIPVWDLNGYLARKDIANSGILWWDFVHLTSYGQAVAAEFILRQLHNSNFINL